MGDIDTRMTVSGMTCAKCAARVAMALAALEGVVDATVDQPTGTAHIRHDARVTTGSLVAAILAAGYAARPC